MTEPSTPPEAASSGDDAAVWVDRWEQTPTLLALRTLTRLSEQVAPALARRAGLTSNELRALEHLMDRAMGPGELARALGVTSAAASGIIDRLEVHGHAVRASHASDGRRTSVTISPEGRAELVSYLMPMFRELAALDQGLDEAQRLVVQRYLEGAVRAVRAIV